MLSSRLLRASALVAAALSSYSPPAAAQQNQQWFVPNQPRTAPARPTPRPAPAPSAQTEPQTLAPGLATESAPPGTETQPQQQVQMQLPPPPEVPPLPKGPTPPAAIVGVLSVADVMRASTAFQQADKEFVGRRQKLNEDAQKEQVSLRDLGQQLANERGKLTPEQTRTREKELQDRITEFAPGIRRTQSDHSGSQPVCDGADRPRHRDGNPAGCRQPRYQPGAEQGANSRHDQRFRHDASRGGGPEQDTGVRGNPAGRRIADGNGAAVPGWHHTNTCGWHPRPGQTTGQATRCDLTFLPATPPVILCRMWSNELAADRRRSPVLPSKRAA